MLAVNYSNLRDNMKHYFDKVTDDSETMIVTRKTDNIVVMSQKTYDNLMENLHLVNNAANYEHLMKSVEQYKNGKVQNHELIEVDDE